MIADGHNIFITKGLNGDIVSTELALYEKWKEQPKELVKDLYGLSIEDKCEAIFDYLTRNVVYRLDPAGEQLIKSPARLLADGYGDCKSLTMFVSCCLHCLGIPHIIRFVNFDGGSQYTHVYPVALDGGREIILDACEKDDDGVILYDYARPYRKKKDFYFAE